MLRVAYIIGKTGNNPNIYPGLLVVCSYKRIIPRNRKEWITGTGYNTDDLKYFAEQKRPDMKEHTLHDPIYIRS